MSQRYCFDAWKGCIQEIESLLKESSDGSRSKDQLARAYLRHLQVMRKLDEVHALARQPQQREAVGAALLGAAGMAVEVWAALVAANESVDVLDLSSALLELKLTPENLEVRVPVGLRRPEPQSHAQLRAALAAAAAAQAQCTSANPTPANSLLDVSNLLAAHSCTAVSKMAAPSGSGGGGDPAAAATAIQTAWRGWRDSQHAAKFQEEEARFLGMTGAAVSAAELPTAAAAAARRARRAAEYEAAKLEVEATIQTQEAPFIAFEERSKVSEWLERRAVAGGGRWPEVPLEGELPPAEGDAATGPSKESSADKAGKGRAKKGTDSASSSPGKVRPQAAPSAPQSPYSPALASKMEQMIHDWKANWAGLESGAPAATPLSDDAAAALEGLPLPRRGSSVDAVDLHLLASALQPRVRQVVVKYVREEARGAAAAANAALPPPAPPPAPKGGDRGEEKVPNAPAQKPRGPGEGKKGAGVAKAAKAEAPASLPPPTDPAALFSELAGQGLVRHFSEATIDDFLGECALVGPVAAAELGQESAGRPAPTAVKKVRSGGKAANAAGKTTSTVLPYPELSLAAARHLLALQCALPLAALAAGAPPPNGRPRTALIYGPPGSGKTLMVNAIAREAGAAVFDLSPAALEGKYPGKAADGAVAAVFAAARAAAPAVVHINEIEKIFVRDEKRSAQMSGLDGEPPCRLRRQLAVEAAALRPEDAVLVLATSSQPQACVMADETDLVGFFDLLVALPLPDHRSRRRLLAAFAAARGVHDIEAPRGSEQLTLAAHLTEGLTAGQLKRAMAAAGAAWTASNQRGGGTAFSMQFVDVLVETVAAQQKASPEELSALQEWTARAHWLKREGGGAGAAEGAQTYGKGDKGAVPGTGRPAKPTAPRR